MNIDFNKLLKILNPFIYTLNASYLFCFVLFLSLPVESIKQNIVLKESFKYQNFDGFYTKQSKTNKNILANSSLGNYFILKATYVKTNNQGYILFLDKSANRSIALSSGESYKNYKLIKISKNYVIFNKNGENFSLFIKNKLNKLPILNNQETNNIKQGSKIDNNSIFSQLGLKEGDT